MAEPICSLAEKGGSYRIFIISCIVVVVSLQLNSDITSDFNYETNASNATSSLQHKNESSIGDDNSTSLSPFPNARDYMKNRNKKFYSWFEGNRTDKLVPNADANGTIIDFVIAGFPKCGTTSMEANLGYVAPMPVADVCTPVHQTVYYSYKNWPKQYGKGKPYRGTKCPAFLQGQWLVEWSEYLPRAKIIVGIRHPVKWFQSFWNMIANNGLASFANYDPYTITKPCKSSRSCRNGCPSRQLFCVHRARFHNALASLGKTALSTEERSLLGPDDIDGGANLVDNRIRNPIFLYEQTMLGEESVWEDLRNYIGIENTLQHDKFVSSHGRGDNRDINFCNDTYDHFRAIMMPISYNVSLWLQKYFIPIAKKRDDVTISNLEKFAKIVERYKFDPCGKLRRLDNGTFILK
mmetsp:Transcript_20950/g.31595  ORF Transcript_20950/g.31595 Transcript_20950/m.31595 type:complete len:408 (+) Transcript_20950:176-1399(+)